jgi:hypothetical protein
MVMVRRGVVGLLALAVVAAQTCAEPPKDSPNVAAGDLAGKVVRIIVKGAESEGGPYLENVGLKRLGSRVFLVGRLTHPSDMKYLEASYWFPFEDILMLQVFNSAEDADKALMVHKEKERANIR